MLTPNGSGGFTAPAGLNATLVHNASGTSSLTFFETGEVYNFNSSGQLTSDVDKHGNTVSYGYSGGNLSTITDTRNRTLSVTTNSAGQITKLTDSTGRTWTYCYSAGGDLISSTDPMGRKTTYGYTGTHLRLRSPIQTGTRPRSPTAPAGKSPRSLAPRPTAPARRR